MPKYTPQPSLIPEIKIKANEPSAGSIKRTGKNEKKIEGCVIENPVFQGLRLCYVSTAAKIVKGML